MANKTIGQLTQLTPNSSTELAIFSNNTTGKATVSDLLDTENLVYADDAQTPTSTDVDFESEDTSLTPSSTTSVDLLQGTDNWSQRFVKISQMFKNIRWLFSKLGNTDISSIGNGTLTGAISTLNTKTAYSSINLSTVFTRSLGSDTNGKIMKFGNQITVYGQIGSVTLSSGSNTLGTMSNYYPSIGTIEIVTCGFIGTATTLGTVIRVTIDNTGIIKCYASASTSGTVRFTFSYSTSNV